MGTTHSRWGEKLHGGLQIVEETGRRFRERGRSDREGRRIGLALFLAASGAFETAGQVWEAVDRLIPEREEIET